jgi:hypothetical protein
VVPLSIQEPLHLLGNADWPSPSDVVTVSVIDAQGTVLATGTTTPGVRGASASVITDPLPPGKFGVVVKNASAHSVTVRLTAGAAKAN